MTPPDDATIDQFWVWFVGVAHGLGERLDDPVLVEELEARVTALGPFGWNLVRGRDQPCALILSPSGNRELLRLTCAVIERAPSLPGWEFHPAKPATEWDLHFEVDDLEGDKAAIDASRWRYVILRHPDGWHELVLEAAELGAWSAEEQRIAGEIVLDTLLGEQRRLETLDEISVTAKFDDATSALARLLADIATQLD